MPHWLRILVDDDEECDVQTKSSSTFTSKRCRRNNGSPFFSSRNKMVEYYTKAKHYKEIRNY